MERWRKKSKTDETIGRKTSGGRVREERRKEKDNE